MQIKGIVIIGMLILSVYPLTAQMHQPLRTEVELQRLDNEYMVMSMKEKGIVLFRELAGLTASRKKAWEVVKLDTLLQNVMTRTYELDFKAQLLGYEYRQDYFYLLFRIGEYQKDDLKIIKINMNTGDNVQYDLQQIVPVTLTEFSVIGEAALLGGYVNYRPAMIHYSFEEQKIKVLPGIYKNNSELLELDINEKSNTFTVLLSERTRDRLSTLSVKRFNADGELLQNVIMEPKPNSSLLYGQTTHLPDDRQFIVGTYSHKRSRYSRGIYFAYLDPTSNEAPEVSYLNYGDMKNFFSYMKAKRAARVKQRVERRKIQGKKIKFNYRLLVHDVVEENGNYLMIGEAYYPKYGSGGYYGLYNFGNSTNLAFEGYKYTHAVIIAFDSKGKLVYDNSFEINDVLSFQLEQLVSVNVQDDKVILLYTYENVIRSKIIQGDEVLEGKAFNDIALAFENDIVGNNNSVGGLLKWYDDYFFAYGVQRIKNFTASDVNPTREVFYINKIYYSFDSENAETSLDNR